MFEKSCMCGKSKKNFKKDINGFWKGQCCIDAAEKASKEISEAKKRLEKQEEIIKETVKVEVEAPKVEKKRKRKTKKVDSNE